MKPTPLSPASHGDMFTSFQSESDRGAAVLAGSYVVAVLGAFLQSHTQDRSVAGRMFEEGGSITSFAQRIDTAQAFGFLSSELCADLRLVRKIRNHFAHYPMEASFETDPVRGLASSLSTFKSADGGIASALKMGKGRIAYLLAANSFALLANARIHAAKNPEIS